MLTTKSLAENLVEDKRDGEKRLVGSRLSPLFLSLALGSEQFSKEILVQD